jgi:ABC-type bacteriocin/lantibiotic exporter with double-glycine peptidase domain
MIARLIYQIKISNAYDVLLFDEIDMNLNNELSVEICSTLRKIFSDKIIMYITHNDEVKKLFDKKVFVKNGIISDGDDESKTRK